MLICLCLLGRGTSWQMKVWGCHCLQASDGWTSSFNSDEHLHTWVGISLSGSVDWEASRGEETHWHSRATRTSSGNLTLRRVVNLHKRQIEKLKCWVLSSIQDRLSINLNDNRKYASVPYEFWPQISAIHWHIIPLSCVCLETRGNVHI